ncbi:MULTISPECIES: hypothetical protein [Bacillus]|uniref:hypothetical protein n=1 Tax=Bacillus TaxID=1386 RepID=UPI0009D8D98E|nr:MULTISPECIES: hypothetical protein [Bacillus]PEY30706.1 hypothetical protein CN347_27750 [Bacillus cereus]PFJ77219.1 hypothetical protein COJ08_11015 [Bacillus cereus]PFO63127.1 hypothetical protein COJ83_25945 [Bacillus cereus]PFP21421.1 hypothetical protein COJ94_26935 [Bacillus cereus]PGM02454.1 hypothetical protein CN935_28960 [Bacillus cereus]
MKNLLSTLTSLNLDKTVIAYSNGVQVFKGSLQDYLFMPHQEKQALKVTTFRICTNDGTNISTFERLQEA